MSDDGQVCPLFPWDVAPVPTFGDFEIAHTHAAKGLAIDCWERMEVALSQLYHAISGGDPSATSFLYGDKLNFKDRLNDLEILASAYFQAKCDQEKEGDFEDIALMARMLSLRRNEIVHSVARSVAFDVVNEMTDTGGRWTAKRMYFIVPPSYTSRKYDAENRPSFIYSSTEITDYGSHFSFVSISANNLAYRISGRQIRPYGRKHRLRLP